jgi:hypothetical protein
MLNLPMLHLPMLHRLCDRRYGYGLLDRDGRGPL